MNSQSLKNLLFRMSAEVVNEAKDKAPYRTGNLKRDIQVFDDKIEEGKVTIGNSRLAPYAVFVHQGTGTKARGRTTGRIKNGGIEAQPYLEDGLQNYLNTGGLDRALDETESDVAEELKEQLRNNLRNIIVE